jgi:hypothetical protein
VGVRLGVAVLATVLSLLGVRVADGSFVFVGLAVAVIEFTNGAASVGVGGITVVAKCVKVAVGTTSGWVGNGVFVESAREDTGVWVVVGVNRSRTRGVRVGAGD